jgi:uncharacterized protein YidB (DUF937 family)
MSTLGDFFKRLLGGAASTSGQGSVLDSIIGMITNQESGGLEGLLQAFKDKGLGEIVSSWVSRGQNLPISPEQIVQALGKGQVKQVAKDTGLSHGDAANALSQLLPQVVDKLTPKGTIDPSTLTGSGLEALKKLLGG